MQTGTWFVLNLPLQASQNQVLIMLQSLKQVCLVNIPMVAGLESSFHTGKRQHG